jgi:hypothetical protein
MFLMNLKKLSKICEKLTGNKRQLSSEKKLQYTIYLIFAHQILR